MRWTVADTVGGVGMLLVATAFGIFFKSWIVAVGVLALILGAALMVLATYIRQETRRGDS